MSRRSQLVTMICILVVVCAIAESLPGSKNGVAPAINAIPEGFTAALVAGLSTQNGRVKRPNGGVGKPNHAVPVVAEVGSLSPGGAHGEGEEVGRSSASRVAGISSAQNGGVGTGSGTGTAQLNLFTGQAGATGQGSGSSVGK
ncbi:hypothetical protein DAPPUDRAFT_317342 [Daphnia pulex]|uniref:Uncharacterized protein n=1 Tax=Daphnia pulex TaxID=6669 RepID=E9GFP6_DAPPU|nr:hypothetical protein DAPPUDRAFT_317342 [Daphnia pulex]|eukprot:EFX81672.1 hypothetical protein DAPPUDRAFT_317342 [Daphnia pulex]